MAGAAMLITGGTGALGALATAWLARSGAAHVQPLGRSGRGGGGSELRDAACCVRTVRCDTSAAGEWAAAAAQDGSAAPLWGLLHAGGVLRDAVMGGQSAERVREVFAPKLCEAAGWTPAAAARGVVLFSSVASALGSPGQAGYAAANAALDAAAVAQRSTGLRVTSVQWGAWGSGGMATADPAVLERIERSGVGVSWISATRPSQRNLAS